MTPNLPTRFAIACKTLFKAYFTSSFLHWLRLYWFSKTLFSRCISIGMARHADRRPASAMPFLRSGAAKEAKQRKQRWNARNKAERVKTNIVPTRLANLMDHVSNWNHRKWFNDSRYNRKPAHNRKPIQLRSTEVLFEINGPGSDSTKQFFCRLHKTHQKQIEKKFINCRQENSAPEKKTSSAAMICVKAITRSLPS